MRYTPNLQIPVPETMEEIVPLEKWFSDVAEAIDARFADTGWIEVQLAPAFTGRFRYRLVSAARAVEIRFDISGTMSGNTVLTEGIPEALRPVGDPTVYSMSAYVNTSPPNQFSQVYIDTSTGVIRAVGDLSRVRGGDMWFIN